MLGQSGRCDGRIVGWRRGHGGGRCSGFALSLLWLRLWWWCGSSGFEPRPSVPHILRFSGTLRIGGVDRRPSASALVEELAGILWRKRRLRLAEAAAFRRGLTKVSAPDQQTINAALLHLAVEKHTAGDTANRLASLNEDQAAFTRALDLLQAGKARAYDKALSALHEEIQERWAKLSKPPPKFNLLDFGDVSARYTADAEGLLEFLQDEVARCGIRRQELQNRALIRDQAFGEALDPDHIEGLARYEVHLDRKLERILAMLVRLQQLRVARVQE